MTEEILVVDDSRANLLAIEAALGGHAGSLTFAQSGEEALRFLLERDFAVILLDVRMPGMGGIETARLIRERGRSRHTPIIFVTSYGQNDVEVRDAYALGAVDFLGKPLVPEVLRAKVGVFVELHRRTREVQEHKLRLIEMEHAQHVAAALKEADQRKDEFLALLGHELRNPLVPIRMGLELLARKQALVGTDETVVRTRHAMERQVKHLGRLVDDLLDVSRISAGKMELRKAPIDLRDVLEQAIATCRPIIAERGQRLQVSLPPQRVPIAGDADRLIQVFANLVRNATQYSDGGTEIRVTVRHVGDRAEVSVADDGRGIKPELLAHVFEKFVQERSGGGGLGLGLMLVKRLTEIHGGEVFARSEGVGRGSEFLVQLPALSANDPSSDELLPVVAPGTNPLDPKRAPRLRLAIVEDNADIRETMGELLEICGHEVEFAADGAAGIELIRRMRPDAALIDIGLPKLDGYQVAESIRSAADLPKLRLIAMTGFGQADDKRRALEAGFDGYIVKPPDLDVLMDALLPSSEE